MAHETTGSKDDSWIQTLGGFFLIVLLLVPWEIGVSLSQMKEVCQVHCPFPSWGEEYMATLHLVTLGRTPPISLPDL